MPDMSTGVTNCSVDSNGFLSFETAITAPDFGELAFCGIEYAAQQLNCSLDAVRARVADGSLQGSLTLAGYERISLSALHTAMGLDGPVPLSLSVLVVEDDASTLELYRCQFEQWDLPLDCTWMPSAVSALMDIASMRPQLLITDLSMPGLHGIELLHGLQRNPHLADLRIMVISGWAPEFIAQRRERPASIELLQKPVDFDWLRRCLSAMVALRAPVALAFAPPAGSNELKPD
jgi:CheY-like chemotaxis protein